MSSNMLAPTHLKIGVTNEYQRQATRPLTNVYLIAKIGKQA
jgi:hypothetical protein